MFAWRKKSLGLTESNSYSHTRHLTDPMAGYTTAMLEAAPFINVSPGSDLRGVGLQDGPSVIALLLIARPPSRRAWQDIATGPGLPHGKIMRFFSWLFAT